MDNETRIQFMQTFLFIALSGAAYLYIVTKNPYYEVDRHYYKTNRKLYWLLKACYLVIIVTLVFNVKYLIRLIFKLFYNYAQDVAKAKGVLK